MSDLNSVVSIFFRAFMIVRTDERGRFHEFYDCYNDETPGVHCHELFIRQDIIDMEQLIADTPHREAIDESDETHTQNIKCLSKYLQDAHKRASQGDCAQYNSVKRVIQVS